VTYEEHLAALDEQALAALLRARPDVLVEPVPRGFAQLAHRLNSASSLVAALQRLNRDQAIVGQAIATNALGLLDASRVPDVVAELRTLGLVWDDNGTPRVPRRLADHWSADIGGRPVAVIARTVLADDLRLTAQALGLGVDGLREPELITAVAEAMGDLKRMRSVISALSPEVRRLLTESRGGYVYRSLKPLVDTGLVLLPNRRPEIPYEVALASWLTEQDVSLTGRPALAAPPVTAADVRASAQAAAQSAVDAVTALLDQATVKPIVSLKKGGVGTRERTRLATALGVEPDEIALWIDLAYASDLLGEVDTGYAPTARYVRWRENDDNQRWTELAQAWFELDHAPTNRAIDDDREQPPPLPLMSAVGMMRRATLTESVDASVSSVTDEIDWFCPVHGYPAAERDVKIAAIMRESSLLGVVDSNVLTEFGRCLLTGQTPDLLAEHPGTVILQSDLTAVAAGRVSPAAVRLLAAAAVNEARGTAAVWRFTTASVRTALDAGWQAGELLRELGSMSDRPVPQPLEYLVNDVARRHGHVRVRAVRSCVVADEATATEVLHTRSLAKLALRRLAPTVLSSTDSPENVLAQLRKAGFAPVAEDADGTVVVERDEVRRAPSATVRERTTLTAEELAKRLIAEPHVEIERGPTFTAVARYNTQLPEVELELLADAIDNGTDIVIGYRDRDGGHTVRQITPKRFYDRWLDSWCHLHNDQRDFAVANIESVEVVG
jgi:Helicase conserved C-terminal domain